MYFYLIAGQHILKKQKVVRFGILMEKNIMIWDVAAGLAIVEGAGGFCVYKKGTIPYSLDVRAANNDSIFNL